MCRRHSVGSATFTKGKSKYSGLKVSEARACVRAKENARLKKLLKARAVSQALSLSSTLKSTITPLVTQS